MTDGAAPDGKDEKADKANAKREPPFDEPGFTMEPIVQPYSARRETNPGMMPTRCPCGYQLVVRRDQIGERTTCSQCTRQIQIEAVVDPQTRETLVRCIYV